MIGDNAAILNNSLGESFESELNNNESSSAKDFFVDLADLDEINALEDGDLSLLADPNKFRMLTEALQIDNSSAELDNNSLLQSHKNTLKQDHQTHNNNSYIDEISAYSPTTDASSVSSEMMPSFGMKASESSLKALSNDNNNSKQCQNNNLLSMESEKQQNLYDLQQMPPPPLLPPIVISPADIDNISIQLEKNQQCACKDCGKLFNSVWYLKQHAVKHSNDRPFKCKFCLKTYKFRSNLYQHKCPERNRHFGGIGQSFRKRLYTRGIAYTEMYNKSVAKSSENQEAKARSRLSSQSTTTPLGTPSNKQQNADSMSISTDSNFTETQNTEIRFNKSIHSTNQIFPPMGNTSSENNIMLYQNNQTPVNSALYGQQAIKNQLSHQTQYSENMHEMQDETLLMHQEHQHNGQFMPPYMSFPNCSECYSEYMSNTEFNPDDCCIRNQPLDQEYIDSYIQKNKNRVYPCRKCKLSFPSREYLDRHIAYHNTIEAEPFVCDQCPQRFATDKQLQSHFLQHSNNSPHKCLQCCGVFRSALALRRHRDQCRQCYFPPFGIYPPLMISPSAPLDPYGFIESEDEIDIQSKIMENQNQIASGQPNHKTTENTSAFNMSINQTSGEKMFYSENEPNLRKQTIDSGIGSDCSMHSYNISPSSMETLDDDGQNQLRQQDYGFYGYSNVNPNFLSDTKESGNITQKVENRFTVHLNHKPAKGIEEEEEEEEEDEDEEGGKSSEFVKKNNQHNDYYGGQMIQPYLNGGQPSNYANEDIDSGFRSRLGSSMTSQSYSPPSLSSTSNINSNSLTINQRKNYNNLAPLSTQLQLNGPSEMMWTECNVDNLAFNYNAYENSEDNIKENPFPGSIGNDVEVVAPFSCYPPLPSYFKCKPLKVMDVAESVQKLLLSITFSIVDISKQTNSDRESLHCCEGRPAHVAVPLNKLGDVTGLENAKSIVLLLLQKLAKIILFSYIIHRIFKIIYTAVLISTFMSSHNFLKF